MSCIGDDYHIGPEVNLCLSIGLPLDLDMVKYSKWHTFGKVPGRGAHRRIVSVRRSLRRASYRVQDPYYVITGSGSRAFIVPKFCLKVIR